MSLLEKILASLSSEEQIRDICVGAFDTVVQSRQWGISSTFRDPCSGHSPAWVRGSGTWLGRPALELARYALSDRLLEASLGMAALNSLVDLDDLVFQDVNAAKIVAQKAKGCHLVVVGDFPFLERLKDKVKSLNVIQSLPWEGEQGVEAAREVLPQAEVAAITASSFINGTTESLLKLCPDAYTVVLGPSAPFSPVLFDYGVDAVAGTLFAQPEQALPYIRQGSSYRQIEGLRRAVILKEDWRG